MKDLTGNLPSVRMYTTNRSAGKTTSMHRLLLNSALKNKKKFVILYRRKQDLAKSSIQFVGALELFTEFSYIEMIVDKPIAGKCIREYFAVKKSNSEGQEQEKISIGYCVSLFDSDDIKKYSSVFSSVWNMCMDEFQIENGKYLPDEITKFQSVYNSIARGGGKRARNVEVFLLSNDVSLINPYYLHYGIPQRLRPGTRRLRGKGWIAIREVDLEASKEISENVVNASFEDTRYQRFIRGGEGQLIVTNNFVEKLSGKSKYLFTIIDRDEKYGFRKMSKGGIVHISTKIDPSAIPVYVFRDSDVAPGRFIIVRNSPIMKTIKTLYEDNLLRFENESCKNMLFELLRIDILNQ